MCAFCVSVFVNEDKLELKIYQFNKLYKNNVLTVSQLYLHREAM